MSEGLGMVGVLQSLRVLRAALVGFDPEQCSGEVCAVLVEELASTEKVFAAARVRAAERAGASGAHRERGFADVSDWMARLVGSSAGAAKTALHTMAALEQQPAARAALVAGQLSLAQAQELVRTEAVAPGSTAGLLDVARTQGLKALKEEARERRAKAVDPEELHRLQHEASMFRHWRTSLGMVAGAFELPPEIGVPIISRIEAETDRLWQKAKREVGRRAEVGEFADGGREGGQPPSGGLGDAQSSEGAADGGVGDAQSSQTADGPAGEAQSSQAAALSRRRARLAADAFVRLVETGGKGKAHKADLVIVCDLRAYRRGHAHEGERCHIAGGGSVPVSVARGVGRDAFLKAVLHDGVKIDTIAHFGRRVPAVLRTALELGAPPEFDGNTCTSPRCDRRFHLQNDHIDPVANGGKTALANEQPLCFIHHQIKTEEDRRAGLLGSGGRGPRHGARDHHDHGPP